MTNLPHLTDGAEVLGRHLFQRLAYLVLHVSVAGGLSTQPFLATSRAHEILASLLPVRVAHEVVHEMRLRVERLGRAPSDEASNAHGPVPIDVLQPRAPCASLELGNPSAARLRVDADDGLSRPLGWRTRFLGVLATTLL